MLFGQKGFVKALNNLTAAKDTITDDQMADGLGTAIDKACRANLIGGIGVTIAGILAGVGFQELRSRRLQKKIEKLKAANKEET